jgi:hypothetical protein
MRPRIEAYQNKALTISPVGNASPVSGDYISYPGQIGRGLEVARVRITEAGRPGARGARQGSLVKFGCGDNLIQNYWFSLFNDRLYVSLTDREP